MAKAVLIGAVPPLMLKTDANPGGLPIEVFDSFREGTAFNRAQFFLDVATGPFYGFNRPGATVAEGVIRNWWRQGMMGGVKAHYEGIKAFSETDFTVDLETSRSRRWSCTETMIESFRSPLGRAVYQTAQGRHLERVPRRSARHVHHSPPT